MDFKYHVSILIGIVVSLVTYFATSVSWLVYPFVFLTPLYFAWIFAALVRDRFYIRFSFAEQSSRAFAEEVYAMACEKGGELLATQVAAGSLPPEADFARKLGAARESLRYERFIFIEDRYDEDIWVKNTLEKRNMVSAKCHTISVPLLVPRSLWSFVIKVNVLLYRGSGRTVTFIGFGDMPNAPSNREGAKFAILTQSRRVHSALTEYFHSLTSGPDIRADESYLDYRARTRGFAIEPRKQRVIVRLIDFARRHEAVAHLGVFGSTAVAMSGLYDADKLNDAESDVDVICVVRRGEARAIKGNLQEAMTEVGADIVWGDNEDYFYNFRESGRTTVDIEVIEIGSQFYRDNKLLGLSIFAHYIALYRGEDQNYLHDLISIPEPIFDRRARTRLLLEDRKGVLEFRNRLQGGPGKTDPRRVLAQLVKNLAWVRFGCRPLDAGTAIAQIEPDWAAIFPRSRPDEVRRILAYDEPMLRDKMSEVTEHVRRMLQDAVNYRNSLA